MGLDTTHDCWHGSYSSFNRWRCAVATAAGWKLGDPDELRVVTPETPSDIEQKNYQGEWDTDPADPLMVLFAHSDCDGIIHHRHAAPLADRLEALLSSIPTSDVPPCNNKRTRQFIDGLRLAAAAGENVEFH